MQETMNIYAQENDKIIFSYPENGMDSDIERASAYLFIGREYTVDFTDVGGWSTDVYLKEFPDIPFNSVQFRDKEVNDID